MATLTPDVADRHNNTFWTGPNWDAGTKVVNPVFIDDLPTTDPHVEGQLWNSDGTIQTSDG